MLSSCKKGNQILGLISRTFCCKKQKAMKRLYKSLVRPQSEYAVPAWNPYLKKDIEVIEKVQKRATRMVEECKGMKYENRLEVMNLTTLQTRRVRADLLEVYKIISGQERV